jgi:hypothetical protein
MHTFRTLSLTHILQYAPVSGTIEEINGDLADQPSLLNKSAEDKGMHNDKMTTRMLTALQVGCAKSSSQILPRLVSSSFVVRRTLTLAVA